MIVQAILFYIFAAIAVASGVLVVSARNPVHSVLFLILAFFNAAGLFILIGAEFLAMILVIVYVGAVAVLFLFVVMMLDIDFLQLRSGFVQYLPIGTLVGLILLAELILVIGGWAVSPSVPTQAPVLAAAGGVALSNTRALGDILYTRYLFGFHVAGLILLMSIEIMLLAVSINFVAFSVFLNNLVGQAFAMFVLTVAAAEAAIGLAILVVYFRNRGTIRVEDINMMRG